MPQEAVPQLGCPIESVHVLEIVAPILVEILLRREQVLELPVAMAPGQVSAMEERGLAFQAIQDRVQHPPDPSPHLVGFRFLRLGCHDLDYTVTMVSAPTARTS